MRTYTEKIHAKRVQKMMEKKDPCACCPAAPYFNGGATANEMWSKGGDSPCEICRGFLGMPSRSRLACPCVYYGHEDAIELTWIALQEKGYI